MNRAVFFDRDGTINVEKNYMYRCEDFEFIPGAKEMLRYFKSQGYLLILVTNQSGIARGYYTVHDLEILHSYMQEMLSQEGIAFDGIYYCPHHPNGIVKEYSKACECRKPGKLLFEKAIREFSIDPTLSIAVGDKERDIIPARELGMKCVLLHDKCEPLKLVLEVLEKGQDICNM
jgi:D-glycero-D-manno-heptose 1,7-bisphosphate phosphatase